MASKDYPSDPSQAFMFPDIDAFGELFKSFTTDKDKAPPDVPLSLGAGRTRGRHGRIRSYIWLPGFRSGYVSLQPDCLSKLVAAVIGDLTISFRAISHASTGYTLIIADYSEIIGSHWLAYVRTDSLPTEVAAYQATQASHAAT